MKFNERFKQAKFIEADENIVAPSFRKEFTLNNAAGKASATVCGLGFFEMFINGKKVSDDLFVPVNSNYHHYDDCYCYKVFGERQAFRIYCVHYDVTAFLHKGKNAVVFNLAPGWYAPYGRCKLCFEISDGSDTVISDTDVYYRDSSITEYSLVHGEKHDYTKHDYSDGWFYPDYDYCKSPALQAGFTPAPVSEYYIQHCPADKVISTVTPKLLSENENTRTYILDRMVTGRVVFSCQKRDETVTVRMSEVSDGANIDEKRVFGQESSFITDGSQREYTTLFTWNAFGCFEISKSAEVLRCEVIHSDIAVTSAFLSDNTVLNRLYEIYVHTQLINLHAGTPSDCPHIERRGYTGDGQLTALSAMLMLDMREFYLKWMDDISDCQDRVSGHVQYTAPYVRSGGGPGGWGCAIAEVPYLFYEMYGDAAPAKKYFPQMLEYFRYLDVHSENLLVIDDQPGEWHLGDWCPPANTHGAKPGIPEPFVNTYFYIKTLSRVIKLAALTGNDEYIPSLESKKSRITEALINNYYDPATGDFACNYNSANAFACDLGLGDKRTLENLAKSLERAGVLNTGIFGTDIVFRVLFENGYAKLAYRLLTTTDAPSFGYMLLQGATTLWEDWLAPRSMCHPMFGACVKYLFMYILGIQQTENSCGYDEIIISPADLPEISTVSGEITTIHGKIRVIIDRRCDKTISVTIPEGIKAKYLPLSGEEAKVLKPGINTFNI